MSTPDYGIAYTVDPASANLLHTLVELDPSIKFIRVYWLDYTNTPRCRILSRTFFERLLRNSHRPGITITRATFGAVGLHLTEDFNGCGEYLYVFDTSSIRKCPYAPGHAIIMGYFQETTPPPDMSLVVPIPLCPRGLLKRIIDYAEQKAGVRFLVGFESEFILLRSTTPIVAVNVGQWSCSSKFYAGAIETTVLQEIVDAVSDAGIGLQAYHGEGAPGQYEVISEPMQPLEAADGLLCTREIIYNIANKHGLRATFAPKAEEHGIGSGAHAHISIHDTKLVESLARRDSDHALAPSLTPNERSFLQGVLTHLPAICALTLPTPYSYLRVADGAWTGGTHVVWGKGNREASVRLCGAAGAHHMEVRTIDGTANPYLALASVLYAGANGIANRTELTSGSCEGSYVDMSHAERVAAQVIDPSQLPKTLSEARKNLEQDRVLRDALGEEFYSTYIKANKLIETVLELETKEQTMRNLVTFY